MKTIELSGDALRAAAFAAIRRELGGDGLVRFLAENFSEPGRNYTEERAHLAHPSVEEIAEGIAALKTQRGGPLKPAGAKLVPGTGGRRRKVAKRS
ncbi:hypothetical protein HZA57_09850 [Candidatus Poribacteria bacterium]|nr:hypothetical protein [Candidatus Poribacteria bacterium]